MPCSPGMRACMKNNPGCQHLQFVLEHRNEMSAWEVQRDNGGLGYKEETADWERDGHPAPRLQDKMIHREKAPEQGELVRHENPQAEEMVLSVAMFDERAVPVVASLDPDEFTDPLNRRIAETIVELEDNGIRANAVAVEADLRTQPDVSQDPRWDSSMPMGGRDPIEFGLQRWEHMAPVYDHALWAAQEVRSQTQAKQTEAMVGWAQKEMSGGTPQDSQAARNGLKEMLGRAKPDLPTAKPGPRSPKWEFSRPYRNPESLPKKQPEKYALTPAAPQHTRPPTRSRART